MFRTGFTRNTCKYWLLQLVVAGKCFGQNIFFKKYLIRFDIQWHMLPGITCITDIQELNIGIRRIVIFQTFTLKVEAKNMFRLFFVYSKYHYLPRSLRITKRILNP